MDEMERIRSADGKGEMVCHIPIQNISNFDLSKGLYLDKSIMPTAVNGALSSLTLILAVLVYWFYNKVRVLNHKVYLNSVSNIWWLLFYFVVLVRSFILTCQYGFTLDGGGLFVTELIFSSLETLLLCIALDFQRKFRKSRSVYHDISLADQIDSRNTNYLHSLTEGCRGTGLIFLLEFVIAIILVVVLLLSHHHYLYLAYVSFNMVMQLSSIIISLILSSFKQVDLKSKIFFVIGTFTITFEHIPLFIWENCISLGSLSIPRYETNSFLVMLKVLSLLCLFGGLALESRRMKQICQYAVLREIEDDVYIDA